MSLIKKLASDAALYGLTTIVGRSLNFLLVGIHTHVFLPDQMAVNVELYSYVAVAFIVYTYGMETAFFRFATSENKLRYFRITLSGILLTSLFFSGTLALFSSSIMSWLGFPGQGIFLLWIALIMAIDAVMAIPFAKLRQEGKVKTFVAARIANILVNVCLNLFFLILAKDVSEGKYMSDFQRIGAFLYRPEIGVGYIFLAYSSRVSVCF
jgi:O-antigen/teichoic acid export membrane protein